MKVLILKGLPASGKSTYAKKLVDTGNWKRVNKDDLRALLDNSKWNKKNEQFVLEVRNTIITGALANGFNIVVDDTNLHPKHINTIRGLVDIWNNTYPTKKAEIEEKFFEITVQQAIERDLQRPHSVGERVIKQMYNQFLKPSTELYNPPDDKPKAIICDIDGTLAHIEGTNKRSPYDFSRVLEDSLDKTVADVLTRYGNDHKIILLSGRSEDCRKDTELWLQKHNIQYDHLYMRASDDTRKDFVVKKELFDNNIQDNYQVKFVLDDRPQVIRMWQQLGLKVLNCSDDIDHDF